MDVAQATFAAFGQNHFLTVRGQIRHHFIAAAGHNVGKSLCEHDLIDTAKKLAAETNIPVTTDVVVGTEFSESTPATIKSVSDVTDGDMIFDIGPDSAKALADIIMNAKTILWNGPAGVFEFDNFTAGSRAIADAIVEATENGAFSLVGGGDSIACINKFGLADKVSYVSTGGGALLEAIEGKVLPGIAAIKG